MWYEAENINEVSSPSLLVYPDRIENNIKKMIRISGGAEKLRPHVKTHKMPEVVRIQMNHGISKFKTSTISETEMVARCGAKDILLAVQPVGPNIERFFRLRREFPAANISCIADNEDVILQLSANASGMNLKTNVWLDINNGMNRTGVVPGADAVRLIKMINDLPMLKAGGLQVYDGHIRDKELSVRKIVSDNAFVPVLELIHRIKNEGIGPISVVAGGTPTFPVHALREGVESSPGTLILWDYGYSSSFADMNFLHAALLLMRVISKPGNDLLCLDLGHKAVASEMPQPRVKILGLENYTIINHNEEHMVLKTDEADKFRTGDVFYGVPWHICPTVDRYDWVTVVRNNKAVDQWSVDARKRKINF